jgi:hypothetical protein
MVGYTHHWNDHWRSTLSGGYVQVDTPESLGRFAIVRTLYGSANLMSHPADHENTLRWPRLRRAILHLERSAGSVQIDKGVICAFHRARRAGRIRLKSDTNGFSQKSHCRNAKSRARPHKQLPRLQVGETRRE